MNKWANKQMDIGDCRVAFANEKDTKKEYEYV